MTDMSLTDVIRAHSLEQFSLILRSVLPADVEIVASLLNMYKPHAVCHCTRQGRLLEQAAKKSRQ
jgi:hypothetical protein